MTNGIEESLINVLIYQQIKDKLSGHALWTLVIMLLFYKVRLFY